PFCDGSFDAAFSYSVIQHFCKADARRTFGEIGRILNPLGSCLIQMPNCFGARSLSHLIKRGFAKGVGFDVRYWRINELRKVIDSCIGPSEVSVHCYFGLGLEATDLNLMPPRLRAAIAISERLRELSKKVPWLTNLADSLYVSAVKQG